uniref:Uncharacterized protein n=1 Tax=Noctiluca scintillans TaxID=2966 RepID=A0A7S1EV49_NOCSC|mmetsp:Transcript_10131/g.28335  ORF Transcript_10131/g.28335 Transcript_10131/m.28335 type:complete len:122 (+) Transcript_10131:626-991(+)
MGAAHLFGSKNIVPIEIRKGALRVIDPETNTPANLGRLEDEATDLLVYVHTNILPTTRTAETWHGPGENLTKDGPLRCFENGVSAPDEGATNAVENVFVELLALALGTRRVFLRKTRQLVL